MEVLDVIRVCLRRWYIGLPILALAVYAGYTAAGNQPPSYTAVGGYAVAYFQGGALPIEENKVRDPRDANPLFDRNSDDGAKLLGEAIQAELMSQPVQNAFLTFNTTGTPPGQPSDGSAFSLTQPERVRSYRLQAWGSDPTSVRRVVDGVLKEAPRRAALIQTRARIPAAGRFGVFVSSPTDVTMLRSQGPLKLMAAAAAIGLLAGAMLSLLTERLITRRRDRRGRQASPATAADHAETGTATSSAASQTHGDQLPTGYNDRSTATATPDENSSHPGGRNRRPTRVSP